MYNPSMLTNKSNPIVNPLIVLREEFDDWAVLFDPDSAKGYGLNPISVFIWKHLDGRHTIQDILAELSDNCEDMPENAQQLVLDFIQELIDHGLVGYELQNESASPNG